MRRYIVDLRIGCVAVVDTRHPEYPSGNGLHADYAEVLGYWSKDDTLAEWQANRLCAALNDLQTHVDALSDPARRLVAMDFGSAGWGPLCEAQAVALRKAVESIDYARAAREG